ncbi:hypothetical protein Mapa_016939 [Marchantia paleacea]|nr:hypothetical protein Mapa_016939 [Marchantia paleacea]
MHASGEREANYRCVMKTSTSTRKAEWCGCLGGCGVKSVHTEGRKDDGSGIGICNDGQKGRHRTSTEEEMNGDSGRNKQVHLVIFVNGIIGSPTDWKFAANMFALKSLNVLLLCSESNSSWATFHGVDTMGKRLADEVERISKDRKGLKKISFIAHSLGGLVARYAIALLYKKGEPGSDHPNPTIAGLEPVNFITVATPHVGSRGNENLPMLLGLSVLEKLAILIAHLIVGVTGRHLYLTDGNPKKGEKPLLVQMVTDKPLPFSSSLAAFKNRTAYANVSGDHAVGWRTASIRRKSEMPVIDHKPVDKRYPHIVRDECEEPDPKKAPAADPVEEEILAGLNKHRWRRVDVSFKGSKSFWASTHTLIQVKNEKTQKAGKDVIDHIIDMHFVEEDSGDPQQNLGSSEGEDTGDPVQPIEVVRD